jgi:hypothetical protein
LLAGCGGSQEPIGTQSLEAIDASSGALIEK